MFTRHAEFRCQQRGIRREVVETLLAYGRRRSRRGAEVYFMDKSARARACAGRDLLNGGHSLHVACNHEPAQHMIRAGML